MTNNPIYFADERFEPHHSANCHLLITLNPDSYSYAIIDKSEDRIEGLGKAYSSGSGDRSLLQQFDGFRAENEDLNVDYKKVKISVATRSFTFVPEKLFQHDSLSDYSKFMGAGSEDVLLNSTVKPAGIHNILAVEPGLIRSLESVFADPLIVSQADVLIAAAYKLLESGNGSELFLNFTSQSFEAVIIRKGEFEFYNIFDIATADEFNYFLLHLLRQLDIDRSKPVTISGEISLSNEIHTRLTKYFENILFADPRVFVDGNRAFEEVSPHLFLAVLGLDLCE